MITIRKSNERGHADHGWLDTYYTFSFADYRDRNHMGFESLRVINEDRVAPDTGFGMHPHQNMEIVTVMLSGALRHEDSLGSASTIHAGEVQRMTAGRGVMHSEFNASDSEPAHLLQIWIRPRERDLEPSYEQKAFVASANGAPAAQLVASPDGRDGSLTIQQDVSLYRVRLNAGQEWTTDALPTGKAWLQVIDGSVRVNGVSLSRGDGAQIERESQLSLRADTASDVLLFVFER